MPRFLSKVCSFLLKHYDLVMLLAFSLIIIASKAPIIGSSPKLTRNAVKHGPIFPKSSLVVDYASGDFPLAFRENRQSDFLVVYFYAPWDSQSLKISSIFERVSEVFRDEVTFVAVNCWEPTGACASETRLIRFPTIALYVRGLLPVVYDGPMRADYLTDFVNRAFHPFFVIQSTENVTNLFARYDNIVAGYFNFSIGFDPPGYFQFYAASMKLLSRSIASRHTVMAVVIGNHMAKELNMTSSGQIVILRLNNSSVRVLAKPPPYKCSEIWRILLTPGNLQPPTVMWLQPSMVKSRYLDNALASGPAAILFLRHNPLLSLYHDFSKLRELALIYSTCPPHLHIPHPIHSRSRRTANVVSLHRWRLACRHWRQILSEITPALRPPQPCLGSPYWPPNWGRASNRCAVCGPAVGTPPPARDCPAPTQPSRACPAPEPPPGSLPWRRQCSPAQRRILRAHATRLWRRAEGVAGREEEGEEAAARERLLGRRCRRLAVAEEVSDAWEAGGEPEGLDEPAGAAARLREEIGGLGCVGNRSLRFYAVDGGIYPTLGTGLGLESTRPAELAILDWRNEALFAMSKDFKYANAAQFVSKFHGRLLTPLKRSGEQESPKSEDLPVLPDFTTKTTEEVVYNKRKETVVLYYHPSCGFCSMFMHKYRNLAHYFSNQNSIMFTRVNVAENDLPWNLRVEHLPVIVLFPKASSGRQPAVLSLNRHVTLSDLVAFVLRSSTSKVFLRAASHVCGHNCLSGNRARLVVHLGELNKGRTISLRLLETATKRLDHLNSKLYGLKMFRSAVHDWVDWVNWWKELQKISREFRLLINFFTHRSRLLNVYEKKISVVSQVIKSLDSNWKKPEAIWNDVITSAKFNGY